MKRSKLGQSVKKAQGGFTLIEILVVIGIIAVLAAIVIIAINPARQFAQARDTQRNSNLNAILNAVGQRTADNKGIFAGLNAANGKTCPSLPTATTTIDTDTGGTLDLSCLVPTYISALPIDPITPAPVPPSTGYRILVTGGRVSVVAETLEAEIPRATPIVITR